jgi:hypothetical protein
MPKSPEELLSLSKNWSEMPPKPSKTSRQSIEILEPAIRQLIEKGYTLREICTKIKEDFEIKITSGTLSSYLSQFEAERKKVLMAQKRAARLAKVNSQSNSEKVESEATIHTTLEDDKVLKPTKISKDKTIVSLTANKKSSSESVLPKFNSTNSSENISDDTKNLTQEEKEAETERLRQLEMEKHYNQY